MAGSFEWTFSPPASTAIGDHDVPLLSGHLEGRSIALLVGAGIAAMKAPLLARALRRRGAHVTAFCSPEALRYVGAEALEWSTCRPLVRELTWRAEHLSDGENFAAYLVAPATSNTPMAATAPLRARRRNGGRSPQAGARINGGRAAPRNPRPATVRSGGALCIQTCTGSAISAPTKPQPVTLPASAAAFTDASYRVLRGDRRRSAGPRRGGG